MSAHDRDGDEAPLDPAAERLRRKLTRLLMVSGGLMMLGFIAVFGAIVYKTSRAGLADTGEVDRGGRLASSPVEAAIPIPAGSRLVAAALDGERAPLTLEASDGSTALVLVDLASGRVAGRYALTPR